MSPAHHIQCLEDLEGRILQETVLSYEVKAEWGGCNHKPFSLLCKVAAAVKDISKMSFSLKNHFQTWVHLYCMYLKDKKIPSSDAKSIFYL